MPSEVSGATARGAFGLQIDPLVRRALGDRLHDVAAQTVEAVTVEVPSYAGALTGAMGAKIEAAVQMAMTGFLKVAAASRDAGSRAPVGPMMEDAYALGRGEARAGRSMDALLAAYRVGARVAWREMATIAADAGMEVTAMVRFAELLFAYIDELSASSLAGHADELTTSGRVRERYRERLGQHLLAESDPDVLVAAAERAGWTLPGSLTAVLLPAAQVRGVLASLGPATLQVAEQSSDVDQPFTVLLVPDVEGTKRRHLMHVLARRQAVVGPPRPWTRVRPSYDRAVRTFALVGKSRTGSPIDTEDHLADLVVGADPAALGDLRDQVLQPLGDLPAATRDRLAETLLSWLLHQGRREEVAAELHVHAQTVRYRMGQLRELYGDRLTDPRMVRDLVIALSHGD
jgi:PucR-like helix-turn-helix protein